MRTETNRLHAIRDRVNAWLPRELCLETRGYLIGFAGIAIVAIGLAIADPAIWEACGAIAALAGLMLVRRRPSAR
jgi:hypothetical protein